MEQTSWVCVHFGKLESDDALNSTSRDNFRSCSKSCTQSKVKSTVIYVTILITANITTLERCSQLWSVNTGGHMYMCTCALTVQLNVQCLYIAGHLLISGSIIEATHVHNLSSHMSSISSTSQLVHLLVVSMVVSLLVSSASYSFLVLWHSFIELGMCMCIHVCVGNYQRRKGTTWAVQGVVLLQY